MRLALRRALGGLGGAIGALPSLSIARGLAERWAGPATLPGAERLAGDVKAATWAELAVFVFLVPASAFVFGRLLPDVIRRRGGFCVALPGVAMGGAFFLWRSGAAGAEVSLLAGLAAAAAVMALSILGPRLLGRSVVRRAADAEPAPANDRRRTSVARARVARRHRPRRDLRRRRPNRRPDARSHRALRGGADPDPHAGLPGRRRALPRHLPGARVGHRRRRRRPGREALRNHVRRDAVPARALGGPRSSGARPGVLGPLSPPSLESRGLRARVEPVPLSVRAADAGVRRARGSRLGGTEWTPPRVGRRGRRFLRGRFLFARVRCLPRHRRRADDGDSRALRAAMEGRRKDDAGVSCRHGPGGGPVPLVAREARRGEAISSRLLPRVAAHDQRRVGTAGGERRSDRPGRKHAYPCACPALRRGVSLGPARRGPRARRDRPPVARRGPGSVAHRPRRRRRDVVRDPRHAEALWVGPTTAIS